MAAPDHHEPTAGAIFDLTPRPTAQLLKNLLCALGTTGSILLHRSSDRESTIIMLQFDDLPEKTDVLNLSARKN